MNDRRLARLQEQIKQRLAEVLLRDLADPRLGMVTITRVELDAEFTQCRAYWSVLGDDRVRKDSEAVLRRARGLFQRELGKAIHTRSVPHLEFVHDQGIAEAIRVNQLLSDLRQERELREQSRPDASPPPADGAPPAPPTPPAPPAPGT
jgi:ribosome-binding factor A